MLNYLWAGMILIGVIYAACTGSMSALTEAALDSAGEAISLCITMAGVMALWMGLMEIGQQSGLMDKLSRAISPFLDFMFPGIPKKHPARDYIATNIIANVLGLGWACTPAGLKAMEELAKLEEERGRTGYAEVRTEQSRTGYAQMKAKSDRTGYAEAKAKSDRTGYAEAKAERAASNEMCTFLILNISSLQLIPVNMIAYRSQYGSTNPAGIIAPALVATLVSTVVAVAYCKSKDRKAA